MKSLPGLIGLLLMSTLATAADDKLCLHGVCIGDDLLKLNVNWAATAMDAGAKQYYANELQHKSLKDIYKAGNQRIVADAKIQSELLPYLLDTQSFDVTAFEKLKEVQAFCTPITLHGQIQVEGNDKVYVTVQSVPPTTDGMQLRVVGIEKVFDAYHPISRPDQEAKVKAVRSALRKLFPMLVEVRNIDDMFLNDRYTDKPAILGFKFSSDVAVPMAFKLRDVSNIPALDNDSMAAVCKV